MDTFGGKQMSGIKRKGSRAAYVFGLVGAGVIIGAGISSYLEARDQSRTQSLSSAETFNTAKEKAEGQLLRARSKSEIVGAIFDDNSDVMHCPIYRVTTTRGDTVLMTRGAECHIGGVAPKAGEGK